ncbi:CPBP family intramembrane glutamic endopeptidase [Bradyrhizobium forestalis]|nr:CPBP family intramembrane glutamic endopeptidase [Bradyrhizobium forestalis]
MQRLLPAVVLTMVAGPSLAAIVMTIQISGAAGLRALLSRLLAWRVGAVWYAAALFIAPLTVLAVLLALTLVSPHFLPAIFGAEDKAAILLPGLAAGLIAGLFEEIGWTGFAVPRLRSQLGFVATGLVVGGLWGLWHLVVALWGSGTPSGQLAPVMLLSQIAFYAGVLPPYRLLMLWVHDRTGSLPLAMLMHGSLTAATTFVFAPPVSEGERLAYHIVLSVAFWMLAAMVMARSGRVGSRWRHDQAM